MTLLVPGTVLVDCFEATGDRRLGGAEFNFAYHAHRLLGGVEFLGRVGDDPDGRFIRAELARRGFPAGRIQTDPHKPTKTVRVSLDERGEPRYLIAEDVASEYLADPGWTPADLAGIELTYFGTTLQHGPVSRATLRGLLARCPGRKFCDLNLRPDRHTPETVDYSLRTCDLLKINREELEALAGAYALPGGEEARMRALAGRFGFEEVCVTRDADGARLWREGQIWTVPAAPVRIVNTVGAGDGFAACLVAGLLRGWDPARRLSLAARFAAAICALPGAIPDDDALYAPFAAELAAG